MQPPSVSRTGEKRGREKVTKFGDPLASLPLLRPSLKNLTLQREEGEGLKTKKRKNISGEAKEEQDVYELDAPNEPGPH